jgi:hypothetical protein
VTAANNTADVPARWGSLSDAEAEALCSQEGFSFGARNPDDCRGSTG